MKTIRRIVPTQLLSPLVFVPQEGISNDSGKEDQAAALFGGGEDGGTQVLNINQQTFVALGVFLGPNN